MPSLINLYNLNLLAKGGPVMFILLGFSILALFIIILKLIQFSIVRVSNTNALDKIISKLNKTNAKKLLIEIQQIKNPIAKVVEVVIVTKSDRRFDKESRKSEISRISSIQIRNLENYLGGLEVIASISPLLGLFGTVLGMIKAFLNLEKAGSQIDPALLAGGIWEALLTTAFGLAIAIPALAAYHLFENKISNTRNKMKDATIRTNTLLSFKK
jgi:biopolymer transport protein ExbB